MTTKPSVSAGSLFNSLLLITFISSSIAAKIPESEWPFEFNQERGSTVTEDNMLTQSVSSDGKTVLNTNEPQPIKKYHSASTATNNNINNNNNNNNKKTKVQNANANVENTPITIQNPYKTKHGKHGNHGVSYTTTYTSPMMMNDQWGLMENFNKYTES